MFVGVSPTILGFTPILGSYSLPIKKMLTLQRLKKNAGKLFVNTWTGVMHLEPGQLETHLKERF